MTPEEAQAATAKQLEEILAQLKSLQEQVERIQKQAETILERLG